MREIKLRAWVTTYSGGNIMADVLWINFREHVILADNGLQYTDYKLMQSTGLRDMNGMEIYEGDILGDTDGHYCYVSWHEEEGFWATGDYVGSNHWDFLEDTVKMSDFRVIGNIFDSPELLK